MQLLHVYLSSRNPIRLSASTARREAASMTDDATQSSAAAD